MTVQDSGYEWGFLFGGLLVALRAIVARMGQDQDKWHHH